MTIPVLWVSYRPEILHRGYADQGLLEEVLAGEVWAPPNAYTFEHYEVRAPDMVWPDVDGCVFIFGARHHCDHIDQINEQLAKYRWVVLLVCGDEAWDFEWKRLEHPNMRMYVMQPRPEHEHLERFIPGGWYPWTRENLEHHPVEENDRPYDWSFAGQVTHWRREELVKILRPMHEQFPELSELHETEGYLQEAISRPAYFEMLLKTKVVPSPSGPYSVDCARAFEALEAGCVPICDTVTARAGSFDYWQLLFREEPPFQRTGDWLQFPELLKKALKGWQRQANACFSFWQQWKRRFVVELHDDIHALRGDVHEDTNDITVLIPTSPIRQNPSLNIISAAVESVRSRLPNAEILIMVDGVRPEQGARRNAYDEYVRRLLWKANFEWHNVLPIVFDEWTHQAGMTRVALEKVSTPFVLFLEHDTALEGSIDWEGCMAVLDRGEANAIQFHENTELNDEHRHLILGYTTTEEGVRLLKTKAWWQRPHLARTSFYRDRIMPLFGSRARTMIEEVVYGVMMTDIDHRGRAAWWDWRVFIYAPEGDMKRHRHFDGRGGEPKHPNVYAYDGEIPMGAPQ